MSRLTNVAGAKAANSAAKIRNYNEIVEFLDAHWTTKSTKQSFDGMKQLYASLGNPAEKIPSIIVAGTNGKSITVHLTAKLLRTEGLKVGAYYAPHILTYNERLTINNESVSNKIFTDLANEVIAAAEMAQLNVSSAEILATMALAYFAQQKVDAIILEAHNGGTYNPVNICNAKIATITRVAETSVTDTPEDLLAVIKDMLGIVKEGTTLVSGDQSKSHLQLMQTITQEVGGVWAMPIRKLAPLAYPYEQLHGRCAALAERLAQMFVGKYLSNSIATSDSLFNKQAGHRGRPTIEAKRQSELHPKKTTEQFWKEELCDLPGRFELHDKEKPSVLLDVANNIDALSNILLGIRLLHYQRPLKGLTIIIGAAKNTLHNEEFLRNIRYFFKKTSGQLLLCPVENPVPGVGEEVSWDAELVANDVKSMKVKARACKSFEEAFEIAKKSVDERNGLVVITGSQSIVQSYWNLKGIKKF